MVLRTDRQERTSPKRKGLLLIPLRCPSSMTVLRDIITRHDAGDKSIDEVTEAVIEMLLLSDHDTVIECLAPLVRGEVVRLRRNTTRFIEQEVDTDIRKGVDPSAARKQFIQSTFYIPSAGHISWLDATAAQHRERARYQRQRVTKLTADIERHLDCAHDIEEAGVTCLRELLETDTITHELHRTATVC